MQNALTDSARLLIMDILVELEDGALANVEIQKVPYLFPAERISCYSSDLLMRQYTRTSHRRGHLFQYSDLKKVYTIVIYEKSTKLFHEKGLPCLHIGRMTFQSGLKLELLTEIRLLALDVFRKKTYPEDREELTGWIAFLATEDMETARRLIRDFPWLEEIYREMSEYLQKPEEVLGMFSEALRIADQNAVKYMVEQQQQQIAEATAHLA